MKSNIFMNYAIEQARLAEKKGEIPVGAIIVRNSIVIASAHNLKETLKQATAHAEILAINLAGEHLNRWQLYDCDMYVTLQPCEMCRGAVFEARLRSLYFGAYDPKVEFVMPKCSKTAVYGGIMEDSCKTLLDNFFAHGIRD